MPNMVLLMVAVILQQVLREPARAHRALERELPEVDWVIPEQGRVNLEEDMGLRGQGRAIHPQDPIPGEKGNARYPSKPDHRGLLSQWSVGWIGSSHFSLPY